MVFGGFKYNIKRILSFFNLKFFHEPIKVKKLIFGCFLIKKEKRKEKNLVSNLETL